MRKDLCNTIIGITVLLIAKVWRSLPAGNRPNSATDMLSPNEAKARVSLMSLKDDWSSLANLHRRPNRKIRVSCWTKTSFGDAITSHETVVLNDTFSLEAMITAFCYLQLFYYWKEESLTEKTFTELRWKRTEFILRTIFF
jgi:hypothetical protein